MAKKPTLNGLRQQYVNAVFEECMARDQRTLEELRNALRVGVMLAIPSSMSSIKGWNPSDHELQIMVSRNCMGEGEWGYYPAYTTPPRYVSRLRVLALVKRIEEGKATDKERSSLRAMLDDLDNGTRHWLRKHSQARAKARELSNLVQDITVRAFAGHYGELV